MGLHDYGLKSPEVLIYLKDNLEKTNALSNAVIKNTPFEEGKFFTFFHNSISSEHLYNFESGGVGGSIRDEARDLIAKELKCNSKLFCIYDDVSSTYKPPYHYSLFSQYGAHYKEEVYYLFPAKEGSKDLIEKCLNTSDAIWHSLCLLSTTFFSKNSDHSISESEIIDFAKNAQFIVVGAYDEEGYIFWKKE